MNNILVINNNLCNIENDYYIINDNVITFKKDCDISIIYSNSSKINITIKVLDNVFVKLFEYMESSDFDSKITYNLLDNANLIVSKFYSSNKVKENVIINLDGYMSKIDYKFSNICVNNEEYNISINHNNSNSISNIFNRTICLENASVSFDINTYGYKDSVNCKMNQDTKIVNLGDNNSIIKPNMFIDDNNVEARHSSIIGTFNEEELFYLMARGINYNDSVKLLVKGYIFSNLNLDMDKRSKILNIINQYWR